MSIMSRGLFFAIAITLVSSVVYAQGLPPTRTSDEGGAESVTFVTDYVGAGVTRTMSGTTATVTINGGGGSGEWEEAGGVLANATGTDDVSISNTLYVDATNDRLGIGTDAPTYALDIIGNAGFDEYLYHNGDGDTYMRFLGDRFQFFAGGVNVIDVVEGSQDGFIVNQDSGDVDFRAETDNDTHAFYLEGSSDRLGIGTSSPSEKLHVAGNALIGGDLSVNKAAPILTLRNTGTTDVAIEMYRAGDGFTDYRLVDTSGNFKIQHSLDEGGSWTDDIAVEENDNYKIRIFRDAQIDGNLTINGEFKSDSSGRTIIGNTADLGVYITDGDAGFDANVTIEGTLEVVGASYVPYDHSVSIAKTSNTQVNVTYKSLMVQGCSLLDGDLTAAISSTGANGRDASDSETAKTWYRVVVIADSSCANAALMLDSYLTTSGASTVGTKPSGYSDGVARHIGWVFNDGSSNLDYTMNSTVGVSGIPNNPAFDVPSGEFDNVVRTLDLSGFVPPDCGVMFANVEVQDTTNGTNARLKRKDGGTMVNAETQSSSTLVNPGQVITYGGNSRKVDYQVESGMTFVTIDIQSCGIGGGEEPASVNDSW